MSRGGGLRAAFSWRGVRGRAALAFAGAVLTLSALAAVAVWTAVSQYLLTQRETATLAQATANAARVQRSLAAAGLTRAEALAQLPRPTGSVSVLVDRGSAFTSSLATGPEALGAELRRAVVEGRPMRQRIELDGRPHLVVGLPLAALGQGYFEVYPLEELDETFTVLSWVLMGSVVAAALLALPLGRWVTGPALRPLTAVSEAADRLARGDLDARLEAGRDVELAPVAAAFNAAAADLQRRVQADARFAADVSHELRNPLTTLVAASALLAAHRERLPGEGREALDLLRSEAGRFAHLVEDLLEMSRSDAAGDTVLLDRVEVDRLVRSCLPPQARGRCTVEPAAQGLVVRTDKRRVERVVANLVANAEQHGCGLHAVAVRRAPGERGEVEVVIDDAGPGVPPDLRHRVFERFARGAAGSRGSGDGAGLGLALAARHAALLGGSVRVEDRPGGGARFVLTLPVPSEEPR